MKEIFIKCFQAENDKEREIIKNAMTKQWTLMSKIRLIKEVSNFDAGFIGSIDVWKTERYELVTTPARVPSQWRGIS